jgi:hypothetical protein
MSAVRVRYLVRCTRLIPVAALAGKPRQPQAVHAGAHGQARVCPAQVGA